MNEILIRNVSKNFGKKQALQNINLTIPEGMFGLLGRNGAGKTTLMRILVSLLHPSSGEIELYGVSIKQTKQIRQMVGYLPQDFNFYGNMSVYEAMDYFGALSNMSKENRKSRIHKLLQLVNLDDCQKMYIKAMSGGMRRRLGIAQAILHNPKILIVDEPTAGLDPEERVRFRNLLCHIAKNRIVLLSTHIVEDIEKTCDNIAVLNKGKILYSGDISHYIGNYDNLEEAYMNYMKEQLS